MAYLPSLSELTLYHYGLLLCSFACLYICLSYYRFRQSVKRRLKLLAKASGPEVSFPLGSLGGWDDLLETNKQILEGFEASGKDMPVAQWTFTVESAAVVSSEHVEQVLRSSVSRSMEPALLNAAGLYHIKRFMGAESVGVLEGRKWSDTRKAIGRSLKTSYIRSLHQQIMEITKIMADWIEKQHLNNNPNSGILDFSTVTHAITIDVVCFAVFKSKLGAVQGIIDGKPDPLVESFKYASNEMARRASSKNPLDWMYFLGPVRSEQRKLDNANRIIREGVASIIRKRIEAGISDEEDDLLRHLGCRKLENINPLVIDNVVTMMWAGHDTTAAALSFCVYLLSVHEDVQTRLRDELRAAEISRAESIVKLPYLDAVCKETLRLHPPALWTNRGLTTDVILNSKSEKQSVLLPKGSTVFIPIWAVHRSPLNWKEDPAKFLPERFMKPSHHPFAFVPFGGGNRVCPGQGLAPYEFKTVLAYLISRFHFSLIKTDNGHFHKPTIKSCGMFQDCTNNLLRVDLVEAFK